MATQTDRPKPSDHLSTCAKGHFRRFVDELSEAGILNKADRSLIELAAIEAATIEQCNVALRDGLMRTITRGGYNGSNEREVSEINPMVAVREAAMKHQRQLLEQLGIGAAARAAIKKPPAKGLRGIGGKPTLKVVNSG